MTVDERLAAVLRLLIAGAYQEAEMAARAVQADAPDNPQAALLTGLAVAAMGETARAAPILVGVAAANPGAEHPCVEFARFEPRFPRRLVERLFQACRLLAPEDLRLRLAYTDHLIDTGRAAEALALLADGPDTPDVLHLRGMALADMGHFGAALTAFRKVVDLAPGAAAGWSNLGEMLKVEGRFAEAAAAHDQAVALLPDHPRFRVNRAVCHLTAGAWDKAWPDYECRLDLPEAPPIDKSRLLPPLRPGDSLTGTTIIAMHEDGFGDTLHFCRYLPLLAERGAHVLACVPAELERVMRGVPGVADVVTDPTRVPPHDFICPMFSLPGVFRSMPETVPPAPRLAIDPDLRQRWAYRLPAGKSLKVGLVWAGQARPSAPGFAALDRRRSAGLAAFEPLFGVAGVHFISLQKGAAARQTRPVSLTLFDPMPQVRDFADTAAIIANLDVVVSVDTSVAHLAGLLGVPVFLMDRYDNCWRWLHGRTDSPWYPAMTIFRQAQPNDWSGAMARAAASLAAMAHMRAAAGLQSAQAGPPDGIQAA
ncbi:MAG TPA: tetratricopeptide repeat protein [Rhodopila sp.]|nr:tetratricopeptide repeat protein [Rhodopila sp.]